MDSKKVKNFIFIGVFLLSMAHPVHFSLASIEISTVNNEVKVLFQIHKDDLNLVLQHYYGIKIEAENSGTDKTIKKSVNDYIHKNFKINTNKSEWSFELIEMIVENDNVWIKYRSKFLNGAKNLTITNTIFNDLYPDQNNLLIFKFNNFEKGYQMNITENKLNFELDKL